MNNEKKMFIKSTQLVESLSMSYFIKGDKMRSCAYARPIDEADEFSMTWISPANPTKQHLVEKTNASIIVCDESLDMNHLVEKKTFIVVVDPRLAFMRIIKHFFIDTAPAGIHPTAFIHPEARIGEGCSIGPFAYIGKSIIGNFCYIMGHSYIHDGVKVGNHVIIQPKSVIGTDGFGYQKNENLELERFPHIGRVIIEDDVEIGSGTCIDRGTLGNTVIKKGSKINNLAHIGHNVIIGKSVIVGVQATICGSTRIGNGSWIAPCACIRDKISIGENVTVGIGAVVLRNVPDGDVVYGVPARKKQPLPEKQA